MTFLGETCFPDSRPPFLIISQEKKSLFGKHHPPPPLPCPPPPCLPPSRAQPRSPFSPFVIHLASSFHCWDKRARCIVGRLGFKEGSPPLCLLWESWFYVTPTHSQTSQHTHSPLASLLLSFLAGVRCAPPCWSASPSLHLLLFILYSTYFSHFTLCFLAL